MSERGLGSRICRNYSAVILLNIKRTTFEIVIVNLYSIDTFLLDFSQN